MMEEDVEKVPLIVVLDANVLFSGILRDTLLRFAEMSVYDVLWTDHILEELRRNVVAKQFMTEAKAQKLLATLRSYFPESTVPLSDYQDLVDTMQNDPKDRHVLAAAVAGGAQIIVTFNLKDFPQTALASLGIVAQSPDTFLFSLFTRDPEQMVTIIHRQADDLQNPPGTFESELAGLARHVPDTVAAIRAFVAKQAT